MNKGRDWEKKTLVTGAGCVPKSGNALEGENACAKSCLSQYAETAAAEAERGYIKL